MWSEGFERNGSCVGSVIMVNKSQPREHELACFNDILVGNFLAQIYLCTLYIFSFSTRPLRDCL